MENDPIKVQGPNRQLKNCIPLDFMFTDIYVSHQPNRKPGA